MEDREVVAGLDRDLHVVFLRGWARTVETHGIFRSDAPSWQGFFSLGGERGRGDE
jgi:hypothetical protein